MTAALSPPLQAAKRAVADLIGAAGGGERAAGFCRVGQQKLSDYGSINKPDVFMPMDVIADLEGVTRGLPGAPHVTRHLAASAGFSLVPLPVAEGGADWLQIIASVSKEANDVVSKIATHAGSGLTPTVVKRADLVREFDDLIRIAVEGKAAALAVLGE